MFLKTLGIVLVLIGAILNYSSSFWVEKFNLDNKIRIREANGLDEKAQSSYKTTKAILIIRSCGLALVIAGAVIVFISFR